jgi:hypothetical protein
MDQCLNGGFIDVALIGSRLTGFHAHHHDGCLNQSECIDDDFSLDRLDWVDDNGYGAGSQILESLLGLDIHG